MHVRRAIAVITTVAAIGACRQIAGVHERASATAACASCADGACGAEATACRASGPCASRLDCDRACGVDDAACRAACAAKPAGEAIAALDGCSESACAATCGTKCGGVLPLVPAEPAADCAACVALACCGEASACGADAECRAGLECARAATAPDVIQACTDHRHAAGAADFHALDDCVKSSCPDHCAYGADWSCVGAVATPQATSDSVTGTLVVLDASDQSKPLAGLEITSCYITDVGCAPSKTPSITDANGAATVVVSTRAQSGRPGFSGYFLIEDPTKTYLPAMAFPGSSITQDGYVQRMIVATRDEVQALASALGRTFDETRGYAVVTSSDCAFHRGVGTTFTIEGGDDRTIVVYPTNGIPNLTAKTTDAQGTAIVGELPPGTIGLTTTVAATGLVTARTSFFARAGTIAIVLTPPTP